MPLIVVQSGAWDDGVPIEQQPFAGIGVGHIGQLVGRNAQLLGKNLPISCRLIQHTDIVRVLKNVLHFSGCQQILDVLGNAGGNTAPFSKALPDFYRVGCGLFLFQQQMEFVNVVPCGFPCFPVQGDPVPYLVLDDQHSDFLPLPDMPSFHPEYSDRKHPPEPAVPGR